MRICNGLSGETLEFDHLDLQSSRLLDVVRKRAGERWGADADDLIVLFADAEIAQGSVFRTTSTGSGSSSKHFQNDALDRSASKDIGGSGAGTSAAATGVVGACGPSEVFVFSRSLLSGACTASAGLHGLGGQALPALVEKPSESPTNQDPTPDDELLRMRSASGDSVVELFRENISDARKRAHEAEESVLSVGLLEARFAVQCSAVNAVLDNLMNQRETCKRSFDLFLRKYERVQQRLDESIGQTESSMDALHAAVLHPCMRSEGRETLADVVPRERILKFASKMQEERVRLGERLEKLKARHVHVESLADQVSSRMTKYTQEQSLQKLIESMRSDYARVQNELIPALYEVVPREEASAQDVLAQEKRSASMLDGVITLCDAIMDMKVETRELFDGQVETLLQRLRELSFVQSKIRDIERQAVLFEEEINAQRGSAQQLEHLRLMPRAYQKLVLEIARRQQFRARRGAQIEQLRRELSRTAEEENCRRREFHQRYGCHVPGELLQGLGSLVPAVSIEAPDFDASLPEIFFSSLAGPQTSAVCQVDSGLASPMLPAIGEAAIGVGCSEIGIGKASASSKDGETPAKGGDRQTAITGEESVFSEDNVAVPAEDEAVRTPMGSNSAKSSKASKEADTKIGETPGSSLEVAAHVGDE